MKLEYEIQDGTLGETNDDLPDHHELPITLENNAIAGSSNNHIIENNHSDMNSESFPSIVPASGNADDIDANSELGSSIQTKYKELEGILQSLKSRLNSVVLEENLDEINSPDEEFVRDLDTNCTEDVSLQEFLELLKSQAENK